MERSNMFSMVVMVDGGVSIQLSGTFFIFDTEREPPSQLGTKIKLNNTHQGKELALTFLFLQWF